MNKFKLALLLGVVLGAAPDTLSMQSLVSKFTLKKRPTEAENVRNGFGEKPGNKKVDTSKGQAQGSAEPYHKETDSTVTSAPRDFITFWKGDGESPQEIAKKTADFYDEDFVDLMPKYGKQPDNTKPGEFVYPGDTQSNRGSDSGDESGEPAKKEKGKEKEEPTERQSQSKFASHKRTKSASDEEELSRQRLIARAKFAELITPSEKNDQAIASMRKSQSFNDMGEVEDRPNAEGKPIHIDHRDEDRLSEENEITVNLDEETDDKDTADEENDPSPGRPRSRLDQGTSYWQFLSNKTREVINYFSKDEDPDANDDNEAFGPRESRFAKHKGKMAVSGLAVAGLIATGLIVRSMNRKDDPKNSNVNSEIFDNEEASDEESNLTIEQELEKLLNQIIALRKVKPTEEELVELSGQILGAVFEGKSKAEILEMFVVEDNNSDQDKNNAEELTHVHDEGITEKSNNINYKDVYADCCMYVIPLRDLANMLNLNCAEQIALKQSLEDGTFDRKLKEMNVDGDALRLAEVVLEKYALYRKALQEQAD